MITVRMFTVLATVVALVLGLAAGCATEAPSISAPTPTLTPKPVVEPEIEEEPTPTPTPPPPPASIGDFVWNDTDQDGIQDNPEPGVPQVAVELYVSDDTLAASTTTDEDGSYLFTNVAPGDYYVQFLLPAGYVFTQQDQGDDDSVDSDADPTTGETVLITLDPGETDLTWDAGMYEAEPPTPTPTLTPSPTPVLPPEGTTVTGDIPPLREGDVVLPNVYVLPGTPADLQHWYLLDPSVLLNTLQQQSVATGSVQDHRISVSGVPDGHYFVVVAWHGPEGGPVYYILVAEFDATGGLVDVHLVWLQGST